MIPKPPKKKREAVRYWYENGTPVRAVCDLKTAKGSQQYRDWRLEAYIRDEGICCLCGAFVPWQMAQTEHKDGRGAGGSKRNDLPDAIGVCHPYGNTAKGSVGLARYLQLPQDVRLRNCGVIVRE